MKLWSKQHTSIHQKVEDFTVGKDRYWDLYLMPYDLQASRAHARMLGAVGLITEEESAALVQRTPNAGT